MPTVSQVVVGLDGVLEQLQELPAKVRRNGLRRGLYAGAVIIRDAARPLAPVRFGFLRRQIAARQTTAFAGAEPTASVGIAKGRFLLTGGTTKAGAPKTRKVTWSTLAIKRAGYRYINPRLYAHLQEEGTSRMEAHAFLMPATDSKRGQVTEAIAAKIREDLGL